MANEIVCEKCGEKPCICCQNCEGTGETKHGNCPYCKGDGVIY